MAGGYLAGLESGSLQIHPKRPLERYLVCVSEVVADDIKQLRLPVQRVLYELKSRTPVLVERAKLARTTLRSFGGPAKARRIEQ